MARPLDLYVVYQFLKKLTTPFDETDAFKLGIIDKDGKVLKKKSELKTQDEKDAYSHFDIVVFNLKKILAKLPGGNTSFGTYSAALYLMKEQENLHPLTCQAGFVKFMRTLDENDPIFKYLEEQAPTNVVSTGAIAGMDGKSKPTFGNARVFDVCDDMYSRCRLGKKKYAKYEDYVGSDEAGEEIRSYGRKYPSHPIIVRNQGTGAMSFLRYGKSKMFGEETVVNEFLVLKPDPEETLGISRDKMPQVRSEHYEELFAFLKGKGINLTFGKEEAGNMKPIQRDFFDNKVVKSLEFNITKNGDVKPLIMSSDNYIIDGHHRWLAVLNTNRNKKIPVYKANVSVKKLLAAIKAFPKTYYSVGGKSIRESVRKIKDVLFEREDTCDTFTGDQLKALETFADRLLNKVGIDIEFTKHFGERLSDTRNKPCIKVAELQQIFKKIEASKGMRIRNRGDGEAVLKEIQSNLNLPVVIKMRRDGMLEVRHKTIMRKANFMTPDPVIKV